MHSVVMQSAIYFEVHYMNRYILNWSQQMRSFLSEQKRWLQQDFAGIIKNY